MKRQPEGIPTGGQFAADRKAEPSSHLRDNDVGDLQDPAQEKYSRDLWVGHSFRLRDTPVAGSDLETLECSADEARVRELMNEDQIVATGLLTSHTEMHTGEAGTAYIITFQRTDEDGNECELEVPFSTGAARHMAPTSSDVMNTYVGDAIAWEDAGNIEDWAEEMGLDMSNSMDYIIAKKAWTNGEKIHQQMRGFLGDERFYHYAYTS